MKIPKNLQPYKAKALMLFAFSLLSMPGAHIMAQQTDPTLTAAVMAQTAELKSIHKKRKDHPGADYRCRGCRHRSARPGTLG